MAPPVVYIVVGVVAAAAAGVAFKQYVYDPHIKPKVDEWWEEQKARHRARRARRQGPVSPHTSYSDDRDMRQRRSGDDGETLVELENIRPISKSSSVQSALTSPDIRFRRVTRPASESNESASTVLDESVGELPYVPIVPLAASPSNGSNPIPPLAPHVKPETFVVGADTPSIVSELSTPQTLISSLDDSPMHSPSPMSPRVQLPTPPSEPAASPLRPLSPVVLSPRFIAPENSTSRALFPEAPSSRSSSPETPSTRAFSPEDPSTRALSPPALAPSMVGSRSMSSQLSFVTANSPTTDFHSLSAPSQPTSPFSDTFTFSGSDEEDMYSFRSRSTDSLTRLTTTGTQETWTMSNTEFDDIEDALSEGSSGSWEDIRSGAISPRH